MSAKAQAKTQANVPAAPAAARIPQPTAAGPDHEAERPDIAAQLEGAARLGHSLGAVDVDSPGPPIIQRQELPEEEEEELQLKREPAALQRQELQEEEEEELQMNPERAALQRQEPEVDLMVQPDRRRVGLHGGPVAPDVEAAIQRATGGAASEVRQENRTGLPDNLKAGLEDLSGISMDDVRVHYNSPKPAEINAQAYTQGQEIHIAPGQERCLPHEAWHAVQQRQGRVVLTKRVKDMHINDERGLETEAEEMGHKALRGPNDVGTTPTQRALQRTIPVVVPKAVAQLNGEVAMTHETEAKAPDGSDNNRTQVGVGERVRFSANAPGSWEASGGAIDPAGAGGAAEEVTWTAPERAGAYEITIKTEDPERVTAENMTVVEPNAAECEKVSGTSEYKVTSRILGEARVEGEVVSRYHYLPDHVSFESVEVKEDDCDAEEATGWYTVGSYANGAPRHEAAPNYAGVREGNLSETTDVARSTEECRGDLPFQQGSFKWHIPNRYRVVGAGGVGVVFTSVDQVSSLEQQERKWRLRITKGRASNL